MYIKAVLYDVGRDQGGREEFYENLITRMADYGYNMLILGLEYRFHYSSHPEIAMPDSLTPDAVKRLDKIAKEHNIQLVPCVNCAGHCDGIGMTDKYNSFCAKNDGNDRGIEQLRINVPEAEKLMLDLYADIYECFSSKYFHIGGDEIRQLDLIYPELEPKERMQQAVEYLNRIIANVKAHGKTPMMWGDMLLKYPAVMELLEKDVIICDWAYFSSPATKPVSNKESLSFFKKEGYRTVFADSVCTFMANPLVCDNATMNIVFGTNEYNEVFEQQGEGVITTIWEIQYGGCFGVVWPWLYLQSCIHKGEKRDCRSFDFLKEYTSMEWGLPDDDNSLERWYQLVDIGFSKMVLYEAFLDTNLKPALEDNGQRPYKTLRMYFAELFTNRNILPVINTERVKWMNPTILNRMEQLYKEALVLAEGMAERAITRKEESRHLLQYNHVLLAVTKLVGLEAELESTYHQAAQLQFTDTDGFQQCIERLQEIYLEMAGCMDICVEWYEVLHKEENYAADVCIMPSLAVADLRMRAENIKKIAESRVPLVQYQRYIRRDSDLPMMRHIRRTTDR